MSLYPWIFQDIIVCDQFRYFNIDIIILSNIESKFKLSIQKTFIASRLIPYPARTFQPFCLFYGIDILESTGQLFLQCFSIWVYLIVSS